MVIVREVLIVAVLPLVGILNLVWIEKLGTQGICKMVVEFTSPSPNIDDFTARVILIFVSATHPKFECGGLTK